MLVTIVVLSGIVGIGLMVGMVYGIGRQRSSGRSTPAAGTSYSSAEPLVPGRPAESSASRAK